MEIFSAFLLILSLFLAFLASYKFITYLLNKIVILKNNKFTFSNIFKLNKKIIALSKYSSLDKAPNKVLSLIAKINQKRKLNLYAKQMPEAIRLLCIALDSGNSLVKSLSYAAYNTKDPLARELKNAVWDMQAGLGFDEAMQHMRKRFFSPDFAYLSVAMEVQHKCGGSLSKILNTVAFSLNERARMQTLLDTKTTQAKLSSKIITIMPFVLLAVLSLFTPGYLLYFFGTALGFVMFIFAIVLELVGIFFVIKCLNLETDFKVV